MMRADRAVMKLQSPEHEPQKTGPWNEAREEDEDRLWCIVLHGHGCSGAVELSETRDLTDVRQEI